MGKLFLPRCVRFYTMSRRLSPKPMLVYHLTSNDLEMQSQRMQEFYTSFEAIN